MDQTSIKSCIFALLGSMVAIGAVGCAAPQIPLRANDGTNLMNQPRVQTLTNLHPDESQAKLYAVNYQQSGLIPMCTEVRLNRLTTKRLTFTVLDTGRTYTYDYHPAAVDPMGTHLKDYFGQQCNQEAVDGLSELDKRGIQQGRALKGMTKDGVIYAIGYPPKKATPTLKDNQWRYWVGRFNTMVVHFDQDGKVVRIQQ